MDMMLECAFWLTVAVAACVLALAFAGPIIFGGN